MFSSHFRLFHIVVFVLTGFHLIVDNIESAFQDQNFHQNFDENFTTNEKPLRMGPFVSNDHNCAIRIHIFAPIPIAYLLL